MSAIDTSFERVFDELRTQRIELRQEFRADFVALNARIDQLDDRLRHLDERLSRMGFRAAGILATGLIALVATQL